MHGLTRIDERKTIFEKANILTSNILTLMAAGAFTRHWLGGGGGASQALLVNSGYNS